MEIYDSSQELIVLTSPTSIEVHSSPNHNKILCNHCKRTATNGIRCLGKCVADNDY